MSSNRPLSHLRVLDFGQYFAGPLVGMMLADLGAEVIRIDPPGGPRLDTPAADMLSRGKRAITLDLKQDSDREAAISDAHPATPPGIGDVRRRGRRRNARHSAVSPQGHARRRMIDGI